MRNRSCRPLMRPCLVVINVLNKTKDSSNKVMKVQLRSLASAQTTTVSFQDEAYIGSKRLRVAINHWIWIRVSGTGKPVKHFSSARLTALSYRERRRSQRTVYQPPGIIAMAGVLVPCVKERNTAKSVLRASA